jgi:hypothetical protein
MRLAPAVVARLAVATAVAATVTVGATPGRTVTNGEQAAATALALPTDADVAARLHAAADRARRAAGRETLYARGGYQSQAKAIATALVETRAVPSTVAPVAYYGGVATPTTYDTAVTAAIGKVVASAGEVLAYPLHTDGGWSAVSRTLPDGRIRYGVALVVGWAAPPVPTGTGCSTGGYCWSSRGLNPHLPWTRNTVTWYLSTSHLPAGAETLVKTAIANLDKVDGFGVDLRYGGRTTDTAPTAAHRFVVVWGSGCATASALACTTNGMQGAYHYVYQARTVVMASRYAANPSPSAWLGTLMHEIAHAVALEHFDGTYGGRYQLMRWAGGPNAIQAGDANGLRRLAPGGAVSARLRGVRTGAFYDLVVRTANAGLGGIRAVRTDCLDGTGAWRTVARVTGTWDGRSAERTVGYATAGATCRAVVRSKTRTVVSAKVTLG